MDGISQFLEFLTPYLVWMGWASLLMFLASLAVVPMLLTRIPADYFVRQANIDNQSNKIAGFHYSLLWVGRNVLGFVLLVAGVLMLVLPGQGLLTIFLGLFVSDFPGKTALEKQLVSIPAIHTSINWIREKKGVEHLALPPT